MRTIVIIASNVLTLLATLPYIIGVAKGRQKPRVATWLVWAVLAGIGSAAAFSSHQIPAAIFTLTTALEYGFVVLLGIRYSDRAFGKLDIGCLLAAMFGLALLVLVRSPITAIVVVIATDTIGTIPTVIHSWQHPDEESWVAFAVFVIAEIMTLTIVDFKDFTAFAYPAFYLIEDAMLMGIILIRQLKRRASVNSAPKSTEGHPGYAITAVSVQKENRGSTLVSGGVTSSPVLGEPMWGSEGNGSAREILIPVTAYSSSVTRGECFVGQFDPGVGRGTPIPYVDGKLVVSVKSILPAGSYLVQARALDTTGNWSGLQQLHWTIGADSRVQPEGLIQPSA